MEVALDRKLMENKATTRYNIMATLSRVGKDQVKGEKKRLTSRRTK